MAEAKNNPRKLLAEAAAKTVAEKGEKKPAKTADASAAASTNTGAIKAAENGDASAAKTTAAKTTAAKTTAAKAVSASTKEEPEKASSVKAQAQTPENADEDSKAPKTRTTDKRIKPANEEKVRKEKRKKRLRIARNLTIILVLLAAIGAVVGFCMFRWNTYDDAADLKGNWRIKGTDTIVSIDDEKFVLTNDIAYKYKLNPDSKTFNFEFGERDGAARYRFSLNRNQLSIEDGEFNGSTTLSDDLYWTIEALFEKLRDNNIKSPELGKDSMTLERVK